MPAQVADVLHGLTVQDHVVVKLTPVGSNMPSVILTSVPRGPKRLELGCLHRLERPARIFLFLTKCPSRQHLALRAALRAAEDTVDHDLQRLWNLRPAVYSAESAEVLHHQRFNRFVVPLEALDHFGGLLVISGEVGRAVPRHDRDLVLWEEALVNESQRGVDAFDAPRLPRPSDEEQVPVLRHGGFETPEFSRH